MNKCGCMRVFAYLGMHKWMLVHVCVRQKRQKRREGQIKIVIGE